MYYFFLISNLLYEVIFFIPLFISILNSYSLLLFASNYEIYHSLFLFLKITLILSLIYFLFIKKLNHQINFSTVLWNFLIVHFLLFFSFFLIYILIYISKKNWIIFLKNFNNEFLINNLILFEIFYILFLFLILSSNYIYLLKEKRIIRKLANSNYEKEKLFEFINRFQPPIYDLYKYIRLLEFTNSYIVEKNDNILSSINFIIRNEFGILFDFYYNNPEDGFLLLRNIKQNLKEVNFLFLIQENSVISLKEILDNYIIISSETERNFIKELFKKEIMRINEYSLVDFFNFIIEKKNLAIFINNALQNKLFS